ncbi:MAG TPA: glycosyl hydrolase family 28-related protein [Candidatus Sulfotelmatobacter sp.]|nr:glycosyl hydrolase family 28-related protein [Candidatus Sulfotelmatobacter sp.]
MRTKFLPGNRDQWILASWILLFFASMPSVLAASFYTENLNDPKAVPLSPSGGDDTAALQGAVDRVQATTRQGIVLLAPGQYHLTNTIYIWPGIRLIGCGAERPELVLPANTPGYGDATREKVLFFFAGRRPRNEGDPVPDAGPGTFYSALANVDLKIEEGNSGTVAVRSRYAQHCFLAHMDIHLGPALAGIHEGGNVVEDVHFFGGTHAVWTSKPSPGWQFTFVDCSFEGQRASAIFEHEAGLTLIRPQFRNVPTAVEIETNWADELWVKDARLEDISGPAFVFGMEKSPRNEINLEGVTCSNVQVFAALTDSGKSFTAPSTIYAVKNFSHGLDFADLGTVPEIETRFDARPLAAMPGPVATDLAPLPAGDTWVNAHDLGAKGDGQTDDTVALQNAIANHRAIYFPSGFYIVRDTLKLRPDTVLIGLHPGATQIILPDHAPAFAGTGDPKALLEAPKGGSNIVIGIGLYTGGNNPRAVAALWKAGAGSMMNDVRFLGGHGTPLPDGRRENPYNPDHTGDPNPDRHWDSQYPSLWVTDGGGGTFLDLWTPSTFARAGMLVSDTDTPGHAYQISSEHHVHNEIQVRNAAHWSFYALQTEEEWGEGGRCLPVEIDSSRDITLANYHSYRVIYMHQPFPQAVKISKSRDLHFRNLHCDSNSKVSFDATIFDESHGVELRDHEFASLDISGNAPSNQPQTPSPVVAPGAKVEKLAVGFFNISGGMVDSQGNFYFVDAQDRRIYRWDFARRQLFTNQVSFQPVNALVDQAGNLFVVSDASDGTVYSVDPGGKAALLKPQPLSDPAGKNLYLPVSDWVLNRDSLSHPTAQFVSPDGTTVLPVGESFLTGETSWGVKSSPQIRSFGFGRAVPGRPFYVTDESNLRTWQADVNADGSLTNFVLFAEQGGESVTTDSRGNVYLAAGRIYVYDPAGKPIGTIEVPERPTQLMFGGPDGKTLFITARTSLYAVRLQ